MVNGAVRRDAELHIGDTVQIGANTLHIIEPDKGLDLAFTFELDAAADTREGVVDRPRLSLSQLGMYKRRWAWIAFIAFLGMGLLLPLSGTIRKDGSEQLRGLHLPSDRAWLPGPLHTSHATLNTRCEACHQQPFVRVRSEACLTCHSTNLHTHVRSVATQHVAMERLVCTSCHAEHEEPARLVQTDQRLCATCHSDNAATSAPGTVAGARALRATDFLLDHPDFNVRAEPKAPQKPVATESGLLFAHDVHLDPKGVEAPDGKVVMQCADCHRPEPGGQRMQPVRMETHCASCHRLEFDPADPDRTVPHGDPKRVMEVLVEYYSARYLAGYPDSRATAQPSRRVPLPAIALSNPERSRLLQLAYNRAAEAGRDVFERRVCVECHDVTAEKAADGATTWKVPEVKRTNAWMLKASFDHSRHGTSLTPCSTCHDAAKSQKESDVLMPRIDTCRTCHGGERAHPSGASLITSTCTMCHSFHQPGNPLWLYERAPASAPAVTGTQ